MMSNTTSLVKHDYPSRYVPFSLSNTVSTGAHIFQPATLSIHTSIGGNVDLQSLRTLVFNRKVNRNYFLDASIT